MSLLLRFACCLTLLAGALVADELPQPPNVLIVMADDCTHLDLPVYGGTNAKTPHIDRLAKEGLVFDHAYLTSAMCQPCRAELFSGRFPMSNGCAWNHSASRPGIRTLPHLLGDAGYRVGIAGKVHVRPAQAFPFEKVGGFDPSCVRNPTQPHTCDGVAEFITKDDDQPFCLVVALVEPHVPWVMGDASQYPPRKIDLPPTFADTPETRAAFGKYLAEVTYMDGQVGDLLATLKESGKEGETLVLFTSEQGSQFPGNKWTCWDSGVHTALIAKWPGTIRAGQRTDAIVHYADVAATLLDLANRNDSIAGLDGQSFRKVLTDPAQSHREYAFAMHNNQPEGPAYPSRAVSDGEYRYIRNLTPDEMFIEKHLMGLTGGGKGTPYWPSWVATSQKNPRHYGLVKRYQNRPAEELYHTASDPYEMTNLIDDPKQMAKLAELRAELDAWMAAQGDPGVEQDTPEALEAAKRGRHLFVPPGE